ncbi:MAG: efflux RND transporter permease subunit [Verrucomicrobiales bacterium]|nr:efflux RND transporter permease subunit [Verrucomicrobiales bacterium]
MLNGIIDFSLRHRWLVLLLAAGLAVAGGWRLLSLPVDAFPDTSNIQVQVNTVAPALSPVEIESRITLPIELAISGLPGLAEVRSVSKFGFSQVVAVFDDDTSVFLARQLVSERLQGVELPAGIGRPQLGPIASGLGEVFHYIVRSENPDRSLAELRELNDWVVKPELRKVPGVAEVNSWGGFEKQYQVVVEPAQLARFNLTFEDVFDALEANNRNVGGGLLTRSGESAVVHGVGLVTNLEGIANITILARNGVPVRIRDVATVRLGHELRRGAVTADGRGEIVMGIAYMLLAENSREVTTRLKERLVGVQRALPADVRLEVAYDRTSLVARVIRTVEHNLLAGALLVTGVLFAFLGNLRAGLIVAAAIPLSMLFAGNAMLQAGIAASLLSLGAVDFGLIVDGAVILVENAAARLARADGHPRLKVIREAIVEVRRPALFGELAILVVFLPILTLEGVEGKLFRPMALTMIFALVGALVLSVTVMPALAAGMLSRRTRPGEPGVIRWAQRLYAPLLKGALGRPRTAVVLAVVLLGLGGAAAARLGAEFLPKLNEGSIVINVIRLAGVSIDESVAMNTRIEQRLLAGFPDEVARVWSRIGTAEVANDPMGTELTDIFIMLKRRGEWTRARRQHELAAKIKEALADLPGINMIYTQPIELRMNEMVAGIRSDLGIKIFADEFATLTRIGREIGAVIGGIRGAGDVSVEQITGQPVVQVTVDPEATARFGVPTRNVLNVVEALGGRRVGEIREGLRRFPLTAWLPDAQRTDVEMLAQTLIPTREGPLLPLGQLAEIRELEGPATIQREWGRRRLTVQANVRERDVAGFVAEARARIAAAVDLPEGCTLEWGGQFENLERANRRLIFVSLLTLGLVLLILHASLGRLREVLLVATGIPFGLVGGVLALWLRGMPFTVSAAIGFIALSGVAILNGLVLVTFIGQRRAAGLTVADAVREACGARLRPVLMTACVAAAGFVPMAVNLGVGAEVQRPLATVVIGGLITNTLLTLLLLPVLYRLFDRDPLPTSSPRAG